MRKDETAHPMEKKKHKKEETLSISYASTMLEVQKEEDREVRATPVLNSYNSSAVFGSVHLPDNNFSPKQLKEYKSVKIEHDESSLGYTPPPRLTKSLLVEYSFIEFLITAIVDNDPAELQIEMTEMTKYLDDKFGPNHELSMHRK